MGTDESGTSFMACVSATKGNGMNWLVKFTSLNKIMSCWALRVLYRSGLFERHIPRQNNLVQFPWNSESLCNLMSTKYQNKNHCIIFRNEMALEVYSTEKKKSYLKSTKENYLHKPWSKIDLALAALIELAIVAFFNDGSTGESTKQRHRGLGPARICDR